MWVEEFLQMQRCMKCTQRSSILCHFLHQRFYVQTKKLIVCFQGYKNWGSYLPVAAPPLLFPVFRDWKHKQTQMSQFWDKPRHFSEIITYHQALRTVSWLRPQRVVSESSPFNVSMGVQQGSIVGPLLFSININNIISVTQMTLSYMSLAPLFLQPLQIHSLLLIHFGSQASNTSMFWILEKIKNAVLYVIYEYSGCYQHPSRLQSSEIDGDAYPEPTCNNYQANWRSRLDFCKIPKSHFSSSYWKDHRIISNLSALDYTDTKCLLLSPL